MFVCENSEMVLQRWKLISTVMVIVPEQEAYWNIYVLLIIIRYDQSNRQL